MKNDPKVLLELIEGTVGQLEAFFPRFLHDYAAEEKDIAFFQDLMGRQKYRLVFARDKNTKEDMGFAFFFESIIEKTLWLDYISIYPEYQNKGLGSNFLKKIIKNYKGHKGIFFEIDFPHSPEDEANYPRKIEFYKKFGAQKLDFLYEYPSNGNKVHMDLYFLPIKQLNILKKETSLNTLTEIFSYIYGDERETEEILTTFALRLKDEKILRYQT